jgi:teichuronic acid biosynthesis glycosyltransferase TuaG
VTKVHRTHAEGLISVICPARNSATYLAGATKSVLHQTIENWELLLIDDGSSDDTESIARAFASEDSRIFVIKNKVGLGVPTARNVGLEAARGRWVAFLDADDEWLPEKLEKTFSFARRNQSPLTFTGYRATDRGGLRLGSYIDVPETVDYRQLLTLNVIATSSVLVDRGLTGAIQMRDVSSSDFVCWLEILRKHKFAYGLSEDLLRYRLTPGSLSRNKARVPGKVWRIYREVEGLSFLDSLRSFLVYALKSGRKHFQMTRLR